MASVMALSSSPWLTTCSFKTKVPSASISLFTGLRPASVSLSMAQHQALATRTASFHCSFLCSSPSLSFTPSTSGLSMSLNFVRDRRGTRRGLVVQASKYTLCQTKRNRSRKSLARTHGFRRRMRTTGGRAVLQRRRAKGRKVLCTKTNPSSGKRASP